MFATATLLEWNRLPLVSDHKSFQALTYLYRLAYPPPKSPSHGMCLLGYNFALFKSCPRGHGGRVVTLSPPTSEAGVRFPARPQVEKLVVACHWSAVYSTE